SHRTPPTPMAKLTTGAAGQSTKASSSAGDRASRLSEAARAYLKPKRGQPQPSIAALAQQFSVPYATLHGVIKRGGVVAKRGRPTVLSAVGEQQLRDMVVGAQQQGVGVTKTALLAAVRTTQRVTERKGKVDPFKGKAPGKKWRQGFMRAGGSLLPVVYFFDKAVRVKQGRAGARLVAGHNTTRLGFAWAPACLIRSVADAATRPGITHDEPGAGRAAVTIDSLLVPEYAIQTDSSLPRTHFAAAADTARLVAYQRALCTAVTRIKRANADGVHALDLGSGCGALGLLAAQSGADSVVCVEPHPGLVTIAQRNAALSSLAHKVVVRHGVASQLRPGTDLPPHGSNLLVLDMFDHSLVGSGVLGLLESAMRKGLVAPDATVLPARATLYCLPVEMLSRAAPGVSGGLDLAPLNKYSAPLAPPHAATAATALPAAATPVIATASPPAAARWTGDALPVHLDQLPHTPLAAAFPLWTFDLQALATGIPSSRPGAEAAGGGSEAGAGAGSASDAIQAPAVTQLPAGVRVRGRPDSSLQVAAPVTAAGVLNAVVLWFDLDLDGQTTLTSAPPSYGPGGQLLPVPLSSCSHPCPHTSHPAHPSKPASPQAQGHVAIGHTASQPALPSAAGINSSGSGGCGTGQQGRCGSYWGQALVYLDHVMAVQPAAVPGAAAGAAAGKAAGAGGGAAAAGGPGSVPPPASSQVQLVASLGASKVQVALRPGKGVSAPRPPWK
ncbi:hypothetical protein QJQ45_016039, partial [Haematococcus lacustris]